jgi:hypothetical protein
MEEWRKVVCLDWEGGLSVISERQYLVAKMLDQYLTSRPLHVLYCFSILNGGFGS